jgi:hypothetical protein
MVSAEEKRMFETMKKITDHEKGIQEPKKYTVEEIRKAFCKFEREERSENRLEVIESYAIEDFIDYLEDLPE